MGNKNMKQVNRSPKRKKLIGNADVRKKAKWEKQRAEKEARKLQKSSNVD